MNDAESRTVPGTAIEAVPGTDVAEESGFIKCDHCGCAFKPELISKSDGDIECSFFRCSYCGKAFLVSVTDSVLRESIGVYNSLVKKNRNNPLPDSERIRMRELKENNIRMEKELRSQYKQEEQP